MTENKQFTLGEINEKTNLLFLNYVELYQADKMSFSEYTIVENLILKIQAEFNDGDVDD